MTMSEKWIPEIMTPLKQDIVKMPEIIRQASGIKIFGRKIKSIILRQILRLSAIRMHRQ